MAGWWGWWESGVCACGQVQWGSDHVRQRGSCEDPLESLAPPVLLHGPHVNKDLSSDANDTQQLPNSLYPPVHVRHVMDHLGKMATNVSIARLRVDDIDPESMWRVGFYSYSHGRHRPLPLRAGLSPRGRDYAAILQDATAVHGAHSYGYGRVAHAASVWQFHVVRHVYFETLLCAQLEKLGRPASSTVWGLGVWV